MDTKKKKSTSTFGIWPPPRKEKDTEETREDKMKPRNRSFVDRFEELQSEINAPIFEAQEEVYDKPVDEQTNDKNTNNDSDKDKYTK